MKKKSKNQTRESAMNPGLLFIGAMFLGIGIGNYAGHPGPGTMIGMGVGFIAMYMAKNKQ